MLQVGEQSCMCPGCWHCWAVMTQRVLPGPAAGRRCRCTCCCLGARRCCRCWTLQKALPCCLSSRQGPQLTIPLLLMSVSHPGSFPALQLGIIALHSHTGHGPIATWRQMLSRLLACFLQPCKPRWTALIPY